MQSATTAADAEFFRAFGVALGARIKATPGLTLEEVLERLCLLQMAVIDAYPPTLRGAYVDYIKTRLGILDATKALMDGGYQPPNAPAAKTSPQYPHIVIPFPGSGLEKGDA